MQLSRLRALFPWRIALLLALLPTIPLLVFGVWFRWELLPLERYYLRAYWDSSESAKQPGTKTQLQWLFKAAPGRKSRPVIDVDVASEGMRNLSVGLSASAFEQGWTMLEKGPRQWVGSAELEGFLKEDFYDNRDFSQVIAEPLLYGCTALIVLIYVAFMMKDGLRVEWRKLYADILEPLLVPDSTWDLSLDKRGIAGRVRSWIGRWNGIKSLRFKWDKTIASTNHYPGMNRDFIAGGMGDHDRRLATTVWQTPLSAPQDCESHSLNQSKKPAQKHSIFPGATSVHNANAHPKPWDESQWIN
jgi:hypothetical protein